MVNLSLEYSSCIVHIACTSLRPLPWAHAIQYAVINQPSQIKRIIIFQMNWAIIKYLLLIFSLYLLHKSHAPHEHKLNVYILLIIVVNNTSNRIKLNVRLQIHEMLCSLFTSSCKASDGTCHARVLRTTMPTFLLRPYISALIAPYIHSHRPFMMIKRNNINYYYYS